MFINVRIRIDDRGVRRCIRKPLHASFRRRRRILPFRRIRRFQPARQVLRGFAFDPKAGDIGRRIGSEQGGGLVMPRDPIAVFGVDELGIGMNGFSGRSDQHSFGNVGLVGLNLHDGYL